MIELFSKKVMNRIIRDAYRYVTVQMASNKKIEVYRNNLYYQRYVNFGFQQYFL